MSRKLSPIGDDELAGLVMAVTAEAQRAGWTVMYSIHQMNGSLVFQLLHSEKIFSIADNGRLLIETVTAEAVH